MKKIVGITMLLLGLGFNFGVAPVFAETVAAAPPNPISAGDTAVSYTHLTLPTNREV